MLQNSTIEINKTDAFGVNAFWMAAFYGHTEVRRDMTFYHIFVDHVIAS